MHHSAAPCVLVPSHARLVIAIGIFTSRGFEMALAVAKSDDCSLVVHKRRLGVAHGIRRCLDQCTSALPGP